MEQAGGIIVLLGIAMIFTAQCVALITAFKDSVQQGLLCLIIPAYFLMYMRRKKTRMPKTLATWYGGFGLIVYGVVLASI